MNILLINDFLYAGGAEVIFRKMYEILRNNNFNVNLFFAKETPEPPASPIQYINNRRARAELKRLLDNQHYHYIVVFNYASALSPGILAVLKQYKAAYGCKIYYNSHDGHIICPNSGLTFFRKNQIFRFDKYNKSSKFLFKRLDHRGWKYSLLKKIQWLWAYKIQKFHMVFDKIISPSQFLKERINTFYPNFIFEIIRNPCLAEWSGSNNEYIESKRNDLNKDPFKIIFIGRLSNEKGILPVLNAFKNVKIPYLFDIYGDGPLRNEIEEYINKNGLKSKVFLKGLRRHEEIIKILENYNALILPSLMFENAPLSVIEAASKGLYLMTMNYGGMKELAEIVNNYVFIDPISSNSIEAGISKIKTASFTPADLSEFTDSYYEQKILELFV